MKSLWFLIKILRVHNDTESTIVSLHWTADEKWRLIKNYESKLNLCFQLYRQMIEFDSYNKSNHNRNQSKTNSSRCFNRSQNVSTFLLQCVWFMQERGDGFG